MTATHTLRFAVGVVLPLILSAAPARADLQLCNRTSYVLDLALGLETKDAAATRGWFRVDPGACRTVLQGTVETGKVYVHTRPHPVYRDAPMPVADHARLCVTDGNFVIAGARTCHASGQHLAAFTEVIPSQAGDHVAANLAEEAEYAPEQARLAGVQRLLVIAGYDAEPVDGIEGRKTEAAVTQFLRDRKLAQAVVETPAFIEALLETAGAAEGRGLAWCNDTRHAVMAALGVEERGSIVTRGWYRVAAGRCMTPEVSGKPPRLFSFAEAVDESGRTVERSGKPLAWGGQVVLCTREQQFEISEHAQCAARGLNATGFTSVDLAGRNAATVRFRE